ncbi:hypothetical protein M427DRAFT_335892 [Gonapodya prolifera JEL478]|uniref:Uncharacterized protein n=1 Tax=Gonapodya prolifera (strain JEL478) TaxID=1344416 RepID=A0A139ADP8_GONPJ|nr:hypothetical protein M427DRAFT_335892 [Gonapodya prolifera JEL478]|eukprot:KXS14890.1 hypothetical protein M427DRAFT_335892 [Gonapodya prolifera JEL478]
MNTSRTRPSSSGSNKRPSSVNVGSKAKGKPSSAKKGGVKDENEEQHAPPNLDGTGFLTWTFLREDDFEDLQTLEVEQLADTLASLAGCGQWKEDPRSNATVGILLSAFLWAGENGFNPAQTSTLCSLIKFLLEAAVMKGLSLDETLAAARRLLICHSGAGPVVIEKQSPVARPVSPVGKAEKTSATSASPPLPNVAGPEWSVFGDNELRLIIEYLMSGLFQHYRLYQAVYTTDQEQATECLQVSTTPLPKIPPLCQAVTMQVWEDEQNRIKNEERKLVEAEERKRIRLSMMPPDPLKELGPDEVKSIINETIQELLSNVAQEFERGLDIQTQKFTLKLQTMAADAILRTRDQGSR